MVKAPQDAKVDAICPALDISAACSESRKDANDKDRKKTKVVNDHLHPCCAALIQREQQMHGLIRLGRIHTQSVSNTRRWRLTSTSLAAFWREVQLTSLAASSSFQANNAFGIHLHVSSPEFNVLCATVSVKSLRGTLAHLDRPDQ